MVLPLYSLLTNGASPLFFINQSALEGCCGQDHTNRFYFPESFLVSTLDWFIPGVTVNWKKKKKKPASTDVK